MINWFLPSFPGPLCFALQTLIVSNILQFCTRRLCHASVLLIPLSCCLKCYLSPDPSTLKRYPPHPFFPIWHTPLITQDLVQVLESFPWSTQSGLGAPRSFLNLFLNPQCQHNAGHSINVCCNKLSWTCVFFHDSYHSRLRNWILPHNIEFKQRAVISVITLSISKLTARKVGSDQGKQ